MTRIAIMQGRLVPPEPGHFQSFPRHEWRREIELAAAAGLDAIEWIYDTFGEDVNPLASDEGVLEMEVLRQRHGVGISSVCADYFMERPLIRAEAADLQRSTERLRWLLGRCRLAGISRAVLPFVDQSRIESDEEVEQVIALMMDVLPDAERNEVELHLETSLDPMGFAALLHRLPQSQIKVNYDSGNSAALGYPPREEFAAYGSRIGSVHIKDRRRGGGSVPLGEGDADLTTVFEGLQRLGYQGDYVLQVARGEPGAEVSWAGANAAFVRERFRQSMQVAKGTGA